MPIRPNRRALQCSVEVVARVQQLASEQGRTIGGQADWILRKYFRRLDQKTQDRDCVTICNQSSSVQDVTLPQDVAGDATDGLDSDH